MAAVFQESDPIDWLLDADGDIVFDGGGQLSKGMAGVVQAVRVVLQFVLAELFHNLDKGLPYFERDGVTADEALLGQKFDAAKTEAAMRAAAADVPQVVTINTLTIAFDPETRGCDVTWQASTEFGDTPVDTLGVQL